MYGRAPLKRGNVAFDELKQTVRGIAFLADRRRAKSGFAPRDNRGGDPAADQETIFPSLSGRGSAHRSFWHCRCYSGIAVVKPTAH
jgi:hypothetical protein